MSINVELTRSSCTNLQISLIVIERSLTIQSPHCRASVNIESRVIPGKIRPFSGGVTSSLSIKAVIKSKSLNLCLSMID